MKRTNSILARPALTFALALYLTGNALAQAPTGLTVRLATNTQTQLAWSGTAASYTVQRAPVGAAFTNIASITATSYIDNQIDAYLDYTYQVVAGASGAASNQVTVGPPPSGVGNAAPAPLFGATPGDGYGYNISLALDGNGDPTFAFLWEDPSDKSDFTKTQLLFRSWNRAQAAWNPVITIATVGDVTSTTAATTSLAFDASTKTFALATEDSTNSIRLYASTDGGLTWNLRQTFNSDFSARPSLALSGGNLYLAFNVSSTGLEYVIGKISSAPSTWKTQSAPNVSGMGAAILSYSPSLALDSAGNPGIAYYAPYLSNGRNALLLWRPGNAPAIMLVSKDTASSTDQVRLVFHNLNPRLAIGVDTALNSTAPPGAHVFFQRSDNGGVSWQGPVGLTPDGNSASAYPFDIASDSKDNGAIAFGTNGVIGPMACGNPKLARSSDLVNWTTCSAANTSNYNLYPESLQLTFGENDKLYLLWFNTGTTQVDTGVMMYREPPANQPAGPVIYNVQDAESARTTIVPGSWVAIYGANFTATTRAWTSADFNGDNLPTNLSGVSVTFNGLPAAIYFVSAGQIDAQVPSGIVGTVPVVVTSNNNISAPFDATLVSNAPSLFMYPAGGKYYPAAVMMDSTLVGDPAVAGTHCTKVHPGDMVLFFVNGIAPSPSGAIIPAPIAYSGAVTVSIGTTTATPAYTGLVAAGQYQMNLVIPAGIAPGDYSLVITVAGQSSPANITLPVTN